MLQPQEPAQITSRSLFMALGVVQTGLDLGLLETWKGLLKSIRERDRDSWPFIFKLWVHVSAWYYPQMSSRIFVKNSTLCALCLSSIWWISQYFALETKWRNTSRNFLLVLQNATLRVSRTSHEMVLIVINCTVIMCIFGWTANSMKCNGKQGTYKIKIFATFQIFFCTCTWIDVRLELKCAENKRSKICI